MQEEEKQVDMNASPDKKDVSLEIPLPLVGWSRIEANCEPDLEINLTTILRSQSSILPSTTTLSWQTAQKVC